MGEVLVERGTRTSVDEAVMAKDPSFAGCSGSSSREMTVVVVEAIGVSGGVGERARSCWSRGEGRKSLK